MSIMSIAVIFILSLSQISTAQSSGSVPSNIERLMQEGKFSEARDELIKFRHKSPDNALAIYYLATLETDTNKAEALFKEVEILADSSLAAKAVLALAEISFTGNSLTESETLYKKIVTNYPKTSSCGEAYYHLGVIRLIDGFPVDAQYHFEQCLASLPSNQLRINALAGIMESLVARKDWEAAIESARTVLEADKDNMLTPRVLEVISWSWHELGNEENANHYTERLLKNFPDSYQAHAIRIRAVNIARDTGILLDGRGTEEDSLATFLEFDSENSQSGAFIGEHAEDQASFVVQASAFMDKNNALKMFNRLRKAGFDTSLSLKSVANKHFYLVQVGHFNTREDAERMASRVTNFTGIKAHIVSLNAD